ncbi:hypothetical protein PGTUg99_018925 [Puccinia graminis f. sp. tritici]|uniref:Uncharacterized protein n=1 Tax=Puccinia graminis f. sp. tritici TaxID=56615 RepID=A0A5B0RM27_PUCGR|nr:hypothetical protein PGTUg99_018925 [Puccinia graminis f. sp. tritici]
MDSLWVGFQLGEQLSSTCRGGFFTGKQVEYIFLEGILQVRVRRSDCIDPGGGEISHRHLVAASVLTHAKCVPSETSRAVNTVNVFSSPLPNLKAPSHSTNIDTPILSSAQVEYPWN